MWHAGGVTHQGMLNTRVSGFDPACFGFMAAHQTADGGWYIAPGCLRRRHRIRCVCVCVCFCTAGADIKIIICDLLRAAPIQQQPVVRAQQLLLKNCPLTTAFIIWFIYRESRGWSILLLIWVWCGLNSVLYRDEITFVFWQNLFNYFGNFFSIFFFNIAEKVAHDIHWFWKKMIILTWFISWFLFRTNNVFF